MTLPRRLALPLVLPRAHAVSLVAILGLGAALRLWALGAVGFNSDEAVYAGQAATIAGDPGLSGLFPAFRAHPLLFQALLSLVFRVEVNDTAARVLAVGFGLATIVVVHLLGRLLYGGRVGLVAALCCALMPYLVVVNRQVLLDGPETFFAVLGLYFVARFCRHAAPRWLYIGAGVLGLTLLTKEVAAVLVAAVGVFFLVSGEIRLRLRQVGVAAAILLAVVAVYPISLLLAGHTATGQSYLAWQLLRRANHSGWFYAEVVPLAVGPAVVALAVAGLWLLRRRNSWRERLLGCWVVVPVVCFQVWPVKGYQYLLAVAPALALLAARTLVLAFPHAPTRRPAPWERDVLAELAAAVRPRFRTDVYVPAPDDPVVGCPPCAVPGCDRSGWEQRLCPGHAHRWRAAGRPDLAAFLADPGPARHPAAELTGCTVPGCRYAISGFGLCRRHRRSWAVSGDPDRAGWAAGHAVAASEHRTCELPFCVLWPENDGEMFCRAHETLWQQLGRPPVEGYVAHCLPHGEDRIDFRGLGPRLALELQYALQCRHDRHTASAPPAVVNWVIGQARTAGVTSLLDRPRQQWRALTPGRSGSADQGFLLHAYDVVAALHDGNAWEVGRRLDDGKARPPATSTRWLRSVVVLAVAASLAVPSWRAVNPRPSATFLAGTGGVPAGREAGQWIAGNLPLHSRILTLGPSMANLVQFYGHRKAYALSVSPNPLDRNPAYQPVENPDRELRQRDLQYIVWDAYSAGRSSFFTQRLTGYIRKYHGVAVHTELLSVTGAQGTLVAQPVVIVYEVRP